MKVDTLLTRALSGLNKKTIYRSPGKMPSFGASTWSSKIKADCSGFVDWCLRFSPSRKVNHPLYKRVNGGWFETTGIYHDGIETTGYFTKLEKPRVGAMLVYPDYRGRDNKMHDGHIGIITKVKGNGIKGVKEIVHCSLGNWRNFGDAIQITEPKPWLRHSKSIIVWFDGLIS